MENLQLASYVHDGGVQKKVLGFLARIGQAHGKAVSITHRDVRLETSHPQKIIGAVVVIGQGPH